MNTELTISERNLTGSPGSTRYVCLGDANDETIPKIAIDDLFRAEELEERPILIKCDVEGAELFVLRGAADFISRYRPNILLSVHPPTLPSYGHTKEDVFAFFVERHYDIEIIAVDHEEHWWCSPT